MKTYVTIGVIAGAGIALYLLWKYVLSPTSSQQDTSGNPLSSLEAGLVQYVNDYGKGASDIESAFQGLGNSIQKSASSILHTATTDYNSVTKAVTSAPSEVAGEISSAGQDLASIFSGLAGVVTKTSSPTSTASTSQSLNSRRR